MRIQASHKSKYVLKNFSTIYTQGIPRSKLDVSSQVNTTFNEDYLVPVYIDEVNPAETWELSSNFFIRMQSQVVPTMSHLKAKVFWLYAPSRILWTGWEFLMGRRDETSAPETDPDPVPQIELTRYDSVENASGLLGSQTLADYLGIPDPSKGAAWSEALEGKYVSVNSLIFRMYNKAYNDLFRAGNLQDIVYFNPADTSDSESNYTLLKINKSADMFTTCNPWPQKYDIGAMVTFGANATAPVVGTDKSMRVNTGLARQDSVFDLYDNNNDGVMLNAGTSKASDGINIVADPKKTTVYALLEHVNIASINAIRQAAVLQQMLELDARAGNNRYVEILRSYWGAISPDASLQRVELLATDVINIAVHPVIQTSSTDATSPQANLAAFGTATGSGGSFIKSFPEHGYIMCLVAVKSDLTYSQGLRRMWRRKNRFDFMFPQFSQLSEQEIYNDEIYLDWDGELSSNRKVFGYNERYVEFKTRPNMITGKLRPAVAGNIPQWTLSEVFDSLPVLNGNFMQSKTPVSRLVAVQNQPHFILDGVFNTKVTTDLPVYAIPGLTRF